MARRHAPDATSTRVALSGAHIARGKTSPSGTVLRIRMLPRMDSHACVAFQLRAARLNSRRNGSTSLFPRVSFVPARNHRRCENAAFRREAGICEESSPGRGLSTTDEIWIFAFAYAKGRRFLRAITASERRSSALRDWPGLLT